VNDQFSSRGVKDKQLQINKSIFYLKDYCPIKLSTGEESLDGAIGMGTVYILYPIFILKAA